MRANYIKEVEDFTHILLVSAVQLRRRQLYYVRSILKGGSLQ